MRVAVALCLALGLLAAGRAQTLSIEVEGLGLPEAVEAPLRRSIEQQDWPTAEALLFSAAQTGSPGAPLLKSLAAAHLLNGRYLQAAICYQRADRLAPLAPSERFALANAYLGLGKRHWARRELKRLAAEDPQNPAYLEALAGVFHDYQWFDRAVQQARLAIQLSPDAAGPCVRLGQALEGANRTDEALEAYREALDRDRKGKKRSSWPAYHLGRLLLESGQAEPAAAALGEALAIDSQHVDALYESAAALRKLDRWDEALEKLESAAALAPGQARVHYALAQIYRRQGKLEQAQAAIGRFRALSAVK